MLRECRIGVEIDGVYWHSRKPEHEVTKSAEFEAQGIQLFRLREVGLPRLDERDSFFQSTEDKFLVISKLVNSLLKYARLSDDQCLTLHSYIEGPGLVNEILYRKMVANLPAPPLGQSLAHKQPEIAKQWAYDLNAPLSPEHFRHQANKKVWWRCEKGHTWKVSINNRTQHGTGCPHCPGSGYWAASDDYNLALLYPDLAKEWHPEKNGELLPADIKPKSNKKIWWQCNERHAWQSPPNNRIKGSGCPYCYGRFPTKENNLAVRHPEILNEWDYEKNKGLDPHEVTPRNNKKVWWRCSKGHSWQATINNRTKNKSGCPDCFKARPKKLKHSLADMKRVAASKGGKCLSSEYQGLRIKLRWQCSEGHEWETIPDKLLYKNSWCPVCARKR